MGAISLGLCQLNGKSRVLDRQDGFGMTALIAAAHCGNRALTEELVDFGASRDLKDEAGMTALHWAAFNGRDECLLAVAQAPHVPPVPPGAQNAPPPPVPVRSP